MIKFNVIEITKNSDYKKLLDVVSSTHINKDVVNDCKKFIGTKADTILIEYPYYDNEYLSTFYSHYSQKFKKFPKECYRIHFEKGDEYLGCTVLRPTPEKTKFGKTFLNPKVVIKGEAYLMLGKINLHIYGTPQEIEVFPWKRQETDISCCAHTAAWTILKYYGNKYHNYLDTTIGSVVEKVHNDWGRKTPSLGLTPNQVSDVLKEYGFSPIIIEGGQVERQDELLAYIESGIPMVGFINLSPKNHAVSVIGHGEIDYKLLDDPETISAIVDNKTGVILHSRLIKSLYVMDDRIFPYTKVPKSIASANYGVEYGFGQMDFAVIPLYNRMQLSYREVCNRMQTWIKAKVINIGDTPVCRIYITSSNSLKRKTSESDDMDELLKGIILSLSLPKFVWCIDFASPEQYKEGKTSARILVDTTSATSEKEPWILRHDSGKIQYKDNDEDKGYVVKRKIKPYSMYINNLKYVKGE
ncbi:MAG: hypothetical protein K5754_14500 [Butyrivibrio sp.]|jgi:hypothetical protein|nr:hypothetical protein [Butyrivibrio sp.]